MALRHLIASQGEGKYFLCLTLAISISIHGLIGWYLSTVKVSNSMNVTDLAFQDLSEPPSRPIPRPRPIQKETPRTDLADIREIKLSSKQVPRVDPIKNESVPRRVVTAAIAGMTDMGEHGENIEIPTGAGVPLDVKGLGSGSWASKGSHAGAFTKEYFTRQNYLEMVRLRIERYKKYPEIAKANHIEGRTTVEFVIAMDGTVSGVNILTSSRNKALDEAAIKAVENASPFQSPPQHLFDRPIFTEVTIVFECM